MLLSASPVASWLSYQQAAYGTRLASMQAAQRAENDASGGADDSMASSMTSSQLMQQLSSQLSSRFFPREQASPLQASGATNPASPSPAKDRGRPSSVQEEAGTSLPAVGATRKVRLDLEA